MTGISELGDGDLRYLTEVDQHDHVALVAFDGDDLVGVARFVRRDGTDSAEAAVTIVDEWQGRGLGTALANLLAERAREEGVTSVHRPAADHEHADAGRARLDRAGAGDLPRRGDDRDRGRDPGRRASAIT